METLSVGMYIRTKWGYICKIININDFREPSMKYGVEASYLKDIMFIGDNEIIKASHNIIDLIEVGDYVNGSKVYYCYCADEDSTGLFIDTEKGRQWLDKPSQIKTVVTKEQFESMRYVVNE